MKTTIIRAIGKSFLTVITLFTIANLLEVNVASAQSEAMNVQPSAGQPQVQSQPTGLRANVHQVDGPLKFNVNFENPQGGSVPICILNEKGEILYDNTSLNIFKKGTIYDLSSLEDGTYTFEISTIRQKYTKAFLIQTTTARAVTPQETQSADSSIKQVIQ